MLVIYIEKNCEKIANAIAEGASSIETKITSNPEELTGEKNAICLSKKPFGRETKAIEKQINGKTIFIIGAGFSFQDMRLASEQLQKNNAKIENTLCLKRVGLIPLGAEINETELVRAKAFGERIASTITGIRPKQENEKNRIRNYHK
ncbi:MAG: hypothetical protein V1644_00920 [Candidatus Micrarchaeota archaeon]